MDSPTCCRILPETLPDSYWPEAQCQSFMKCHWIQQMLKWFIFNCLICEAFDISSLHHNKGTYGISYPVWIMFHGITKSHEVLEDGAEYSFCSLWDNSSFISVDLIGNSSGESKGPILKPL